MFLYCSACVLGWVSLGACVSWPLVLSCADGEKTGYKWSLGRMGKGEVERKEAGIREGLGEWQATMKMLTKAGGP